MVYTGFFFKLLLLLLCFAKSKFHSAEEGTTKSVFQASLTVDGMEDVLQPQGHFLWFKDITDSVKNRPATFFSVFVWCQCISWGLLPQGCKGISLRLLVVESKKWQKPLQIMDHKARYF